jgi:hypothetical protein
MSIAQVIHGTRDQILDHLKTVHGRSQLTLIVENADEHPDAVANLHEASPEERSRALDEIAASNKDVPILPPEAFNRESLYADEA